MQAANVPVDDVVDFPSNAEVIEGGIPWRDSWNVTYHLKFYSWMK